MPQLLNIFSIFLIQLYENPYDNLICFLDTIWVQKIIILNKVKKEYYLMKQDNKHIFDKIIFLKYRTRQKNATERINVFSIILKLMEPKQTRFKKNAI